MLVSVAVNIDVCFSKSKHFCTSHSIANASVNGLPCSFCAWFHKCCNSLCADISTPFCFVKMNILLPKVSENADMDEYLFSTCNKEGIFPIPMNFFAKQCLLDLSTF